METRKVKQLVATAKTEAYDKGWNDCKAAHYETMLFGQAVYNLARQSCDIREVTLADIINEANEIELRKDDIE